MDPTVNNEKIVPDRPLLRYTTYLAVSIIVMQVLVAVVTYPFMRLYGIIVIVLAASFIPAIYSYAVYQRVVVHGNQQLSPPFDGEEGV